MVFNMKKPENSIPELEREEAKRAEELAVAQEAHDKKAPEDTKHRDAAVQAKQKLEDVKVRLADARAEEKRQEFARTLDPLIEALGGARKAVAAANERALAAALP
jgi:hypothetical protein